MTSSPAEHYRPLLEAVSFAARTHDGQKRKDGQTPYVSHVFRVTLVLRDVFGVDDTRVLTAAVLHDTVEDTSTDFDDLAERFGADVARWVAALSKDKRRPEAERERAYEQELARGPWQVKVCKLADVFDNLMDTLHLPADQKVRVFEHAQRYLNAVRQDLPEQASGPWQIVADLLASLAANVQRAE